MGMGIIPYIIGKKLAKKTDPFKLIKKADEGSARLKYMEAHDLYGHGIPFTKKWKKSYTKAKKGIAVMNKKELWRKYL